MTSSRQSKIVELNQESNFGCSKRKTINPSDGPAAVGRNAMWSPISERGSKQIRMHRGALGALALVALGAVIATAAQAQTWVPVSGTLSQISVGNSTTIWGVDSSNNVFMYGNNGSFIKLPGLLAQVAVGSDGVTWGINSSQQIWQYQSSTNNWRNLPGSLTSIYVGSRDSVWGLNSAGSIYRFDPAIQAWDHIPGTLTELSVASDGVVVGLNNAGKLFFFEPMTQKFVGVTGVAGAPPLSQVAAGFGSAVFALDTSGNAYQFDIVSQQLITIQGNFSQVAVGSNYAIYSVDSTQAAYQYSIQTGIWTALPGAALTQIAVSSDGTVWGLSSTGQIYYLQH